MTIERILLLRKVLERYLVKSAKNCEIILFEKKVEYIFGAKAYCRGMLFCYVGFQKKMCLFIQKHTKIYKIFAFKTYL